jgi:hypothetical protein
MAEWLYPLPVAGLSPTGVAQVMGESTGHCTKSTCAFSLAGIVPNPDSASGMHRYIVSV